MKGEPNQPAGARGDSRGGGAIYAAAVLQQPSNIVALTHPSNLRDIRARIVRASSPGAHVHEGGSRGTRMPNTLGLEHAAIPQQRIEDAGEATGEGDDSHLFPAAGGDAQRPGPQLLRLRRSTMPGASATRISSKPTSASCPASTAPARHSAAVPSPRPATRAPAGC